MYLDGKEVSTASARYLTSFFTAAGYDRDDKAVVIKTTNYHATPVQADIRLNGAKRVSKTGRHIVINSADLYDQNTLDNPRKIVPQDKPLNNCGDNFTVTLAPYSVNVLRIPATK